MKDGQDMNSGDGRKGIPGEGIVRAVVARKTQLRNRSVVWVSLAVQCIKV